MSYQMISNKQLSVSVAVIILSIAVCIFLMKVIFDREELPEVWMSQGACVKVVNFKNGDGYTCQDKDVVLRKYIVVHAQ
jgi:hypothetical protein